MVAATDIAPAESFDSNDLRAKEGGIVARLTERVLDNPQWLFALLRCFWPIPSFRNWVFVTRCDDVQEVLSHDRDFPVPFGPKIRELNGGPNFILGMEDGTEYRRYQKQVMQAFRYEDVSAVVAPMANALATQIIAESKGRLDAVQDLITRVPTRISARYYGVPVPESMEVEFGHWTMAMSTYMFGDPTNYPPYARAARAGGARLRPIVDQAIADAKHAGGAGDETVLQRLVAMQAAGAPGLSDEVIRAYLIGMITGFVPTNTMGAGHMLEMLFRRPDFMAHTRAAALANDDELLRRCLFEAMRFMPLNPGPFRDCASTYTIAAGTKRAKTVTAGMKLVASTQSAMFDGRRIANPRAFDPNRKPSESMLFGYGLHWCIGAFIASAQITQTLKPLLVRGNLRRAQGRDGQLQKLGPFPEHLVVEFDN
jgi:cytochrome P450